jgi:hypothetical protein
MLAQGVWAEPAAKGHPPPADCEARPAWAQHAPEFSEVAEAVLSAEPQQLPEEPVNIEPTGLPPCSPPVESVVARLNPLVATPSTAAKATARRSNFPRLFFIETLPDR